MRALREAAFARLDPRAAEAEPSRTSRFVAWGVALPNLLIFRRAQSQLWSDLSSRASAPSAASPEPQRLALRA